MLRPLFLLLVLAMALRVQADDAPLNDAPEHSRKIAFWSPQFSDESLGLDQECLERVASWLREAKFEVQWLRGEQISEGKTLNASEFCAIFLPGEPILAWHEAPLERFARDGGVLVAVQTHRQPWSLPLVPDMNGKPRRQPRAPRLNALSQLFGVTWKAPTQSALIHEIAPLLRESWPLDEAETTPAPIRQIVPILEMELAPETQILPMIQSNSAKGEARAPAAMILRRENRRAVVVGDGFWSSDQWSDAPKFWRAIGVWCQKTALPNSNAGRK